MNYDAILLVSFGGPEGPDDVMPFMENVLRGRPIPRERMLEVAEHYVGRGGVSPINAQNRTLRAHLNEALSATGLDMPVYWANRNWQPYIPEVLAQMTRDGVKHFLALMTSSYSSYSGCRQYRENLDQALAAIEGGPAYGKLRVWYNHPLWIEVLVARYEEALSQIPLERQAEVQVAFTAHSIPMGMADGCDYVAQLLETCRLVAEQAGITHWKLVYQSRSGSPHQPWLEPDICDHLEELKTQGATDVIIHPIGFISDHMEVIHDLDTEAMEKAEEIGLNLVRAGTAGVHPLFIDMLVELIRERLDPTLPKRALGERGPNHDTCPADCCLAGGKPHRK